MNKRTQQQKAQGEGFSYMQWQYMIDFTRTICFCCGRPSCQSDLHADHVIPISKGGAHDIRNIQPLCADCNLRKHDKTADYRSSEFKKWVDEELAHIGFKCVTCNAFWEGDLIKPRKGLKQSLRNGCIGGTGHGLVLVKPLYPNIPLRAL